MMKYTSMSKQVASLILVALLSILAMPISSFGCSLPEPQQTSSPNWIEVGTVKGRAYPPNNYYGQPCTAKLTISNELILYVMYLGDKLIYRVKFNGEYYSATRSDYNKEDSDAVANIKNFINLTVKRQDGSTFVVEQASTPVHFSVPTW